MFAQGKNRDLRKLSWGLHAAGLAVLAAGALIAHQLAFHPLAGQSREDKYQSERLARLLHRAPAVRREHAELLKRLKEIEERTKTVRQSVPNEPGEAEYLRRLTRSAELEHVRIQNLQVGEATRRENHSQLTLQLALAGDYEGLCGFFDRLSEIPRVTSIENLDLRASPEETVYPVDITLTLYFGMRDPPPPADTRQNGST